MTLEKLHEMGLINDSTMIYVRGADDRFICKGNWFQDRVLDYMTAEIDSFSWNTANSISVDLQ